MAILEPFEQFLRQLCLIFASNSKSSLNMMHFVRRLSIPACLRLIDIAKV